MQSVFTVDCHYERPGRAAAYLIIEGAKAAFVDNNTRYAVPHLLAALKEHGLGPEAVEFIIITHVHLDHAGGTAELLKHCPNATVLAHPKAARHLADPARLVAGAKVVYGEAEFDALYGEVVGVDPSRVQIIADGESIAWGSRSLDFFYTLGHATHHFSIFDTGTNGVFTGDAFGIGQSDVSRPGPSFLAISSSPADFDAEEARRSARRIVDTGATVAHVAHFGPFTDLQRGRDQLLRNADQLEAILEDAIASDVPNESLEAWCKPRVVAATQEHLHWCGVTDIAGDIAWLERDIRLNAMGLAIVAQRRRAGR